MSDLMRKLEEQVVLAFEVDGFLDRLNDMDPAKRVYAMRRVNEMCAAKGGAPIFLPDDFARAARGEAL